jgi:hypothetical protein
MVLFQVSTYQDHDPVQQRPRKPHGSLTQASRAPFVACLTGEYLYVYYTVQLDLAGRLNLGVFGPTFRSDIFTS